jgi:hypothetical protein
LRTAPLLDADSVERRGTEEGCGCSHSLLHFASARQRHCWAKI